MSQEVSKVEVKRTTGSLDAYLTSLIKTATIKRSEFKAEMMPFVDRKSSISKTISSTRNTIIEGKSDEKLSEFRQKLKELETQRKALSKEASEATKDTKFVADTYRKAVIYTAFHVLPRMTEEEQGEVMPETGIAPELQLNSKKFKIPF